MGVKIKCPASSDVKMSWFKNLRSSSSLFQINASSNNARKSISQDLAEKNNINGEIDASAALESLKCHWAQAWSIMQTKCVPSIEPISTDDITSIVNHIDHILTLLVQECQGVINSHTTSSPVMLSPLLDYLLMESVLDKLLSWSLHCGGWYDIMLLEQLKLYELLVSQLCQPEVLFQKPLIRPLSILLSQCHNKTCHLEVDKRLVVLLNTLCVCIGKNINLIELFFIEQPDPSQHKFLIFSLLVPFVHREGAIGQQARDALLLCMAIARTNDVIGKYIAEESDFCPVLATGLSGLYSALPRKLSNQSFYADDWQRITNDDVQEIPELETFLNSLEFCNAVVQISHPIVQQKLLDYIYNGFLVLVVGPALHQVS